MNNLSALSTLVVPVSTQGNSLYNESTLQKWSTVLKHQPGNLEANLEMARTLIVMGRSVQAISHLQSFLQTRSKQQFCREGFLILAQAFYDLNDFDAAFIPLNMVLKYFPDDPLALALQGMVHQKLGKRGADHYIRRAKSLAPHHSAVALVCLEYKVNTLPLAALEEINQKLMESPKSEILFFLKIKALASLQREKEAYLFLKEESKSFEETTRFLIKKAEWASVLGYFKEALQILDALLCHSPDSWPARFQRAQLLSRSTDLREVERSLADSHWLRQQNPENHLVVFHLSSALLALGRFHELERMLSGLIALNPRTETGFYALRATCLSELKEYERALVDLNKHLSDPGLREDLSIYNLRATVLRHLGKYDDALSDQKKCMRDKRYQTYLHYSQLLECTTHLHLDADSLATLNKMYILRNNTLPAELFEKRSGLFVKLRAFTQARDDMQSALKLQPGNEIWKCKLAVIERLREEALSTSQTEVPAPRSARIPAKREVLVDATNVSEAAIAEKKRLLDTAKEEKLARHREAEKKKEELRLSKVSLQKKSMLLMDTLKLPLPLEKEESYSESHSLETWASRAQRLMRLPAIERPKEETVHKVNAEKQQAWDLAEAHWKKIQEIAKENAQESAPRELFLRNALLYYFFQLGIVLSEMNGELKTPCTRLRDSIRHAPEYISYLTLRQWVASLKKSRFGDYLKLSQQGHPPSEVPLIPQIPVSREVDNTELINRIQRELNGMEIYIQAYENPEEAIKTNEIVQGALRVAFSIIGKSIVKLSGKTPFQWNAYLRNLVAGGNLVAHNGLSQDKITPASLWQLYLERHHIASIGT